MPPHYDENSTSVLDDLLDGPSGARPKYIQCGFSLRESLIPAPQSNKAPEQKQPKQERKHLTVEVLRSVSDGDSGVSVASGSTSPAFTPRGSSSDDEVVDLESIVFKEPDLAKTTRFGRYKLVESQQSGVTASVFAARDYYTGEKVALKILNANENANFRLAEHECQLLQQIGAHPNIATLKGMSVQKGGRIAIATEFVGPDLFDVLVAREWSISHHDFLDYAIQLASAVQHMHRQGFAHRDIKPENVCLADDGTIKLVDFGVARHIDAPGHARRQAGTPGFMAPEQLDNINTSKLQLLPTDIFALGVTYFNLLTGGVPFNDAADFDPEFRLFLRGAQFRSRRKGAAWRMIPREFLPLIFGMLSVDVESRWTIDEVLAYLQHIRDNPLSTELPPLPMRESPSTVSISSLVGNVQNWLRTAKKSGRAS